MILIDAGPLIAVIDRGDPDHERCIEALQDLRRPLITTWPAVTEAMHLLGAAAGWRGQAPLWDLVTQQDLVIEPLTRPMQDRAAQLMEKYQDVPMDLADATLVALAEAKRLSRIVTLDRDFEVYRLHGRKVFKLLP